jgi:monofunctional biosynthetic peptidoglycan transglycosylase
MRLAARWAVIGRALRRGCARFFLLLILLAALYAGYCALTWPDIAALATREPRTTAFIEHYRSQQRARGEAEAPAWVWVPYARISPHLKRAVLVGEDIQFFSHHGFDTGEIRAALRDAWLERELPRGASTITQQVAKNLWLSGRWNPVRKVREALLTRALEKHLGKRRILEIYLNVAEFAPGVYGAEAAARRFFAEPAAGVDVQQAAALAAGLPRPATWHPGCTTAGYQRRVRSLLARMAKADFLGREI